MADDLGKHLLSLYDLDENVEISTPNIDRLAAEGAIFDNAYASPLCLVTRAELATGRFPFNTGMIGNVDDAVINEGRLFLDPKYHRGFAVLKALLRRTVARTHDDSGKLSARSATC